MPTAAVNGISLYYETAGHETGGHGLPVVFVHGFACGIRSWDRQVRAFALRHRVITYDVRGHGISEAPREAAAYSQATSVADLRGLLDHLGMERAVVGGLSMGGNIALNFALAHPDMVAALLVADTGAGSDATADWVATVHGLADTLDRGGVEAFADEAFANPLFARYTSQGPEAERFLRACLMTHRAHGLAATAREVLAKRPTIYSLEPRLRGLRTPTLLMVGERDEHCLAVHRFMAATIPGATAVVIRGAGHLTNLEAPAKFNAVVRRFLSKIPG